MASPTLRAPSIETLSALMHHAATLLDTPIEAHTFAEFFRKFSMAIPAGLQIPPKTPAENIIDDMSDFLEQAAKKPPSNERVCDICL